MANSQNKFDIYPPHIVTIHCTKIGKELVNGFMHCDKNIYQNQIKNIHNCFILAWSQNLFYVHQVSMVSHQCTKCEENWTWHFWEITPDGRTHAHTEVYWANFKNPLWWEPMGDDDVKPQYMMQFQGGMNIKCTIL